MSRNSPIPVLLLLILASTALFGSAWAAEGWYVKLRHAEDPQVSFIELRMEGEKVRASADGQMQEVILDAEAFTVIDHGEKTFTRLTYAQIEATILPMIQAMQGAAEAERKELEAAVEELPPEERAEVEKQLAE